ncbi:MAG TPA: hypothetical protein VG079_05295 [Gaiellaceae bacterium]|nr:hypothetical protein [Gaiellaceae bacterium]
MGSETPGADGFETRGELRFRDPDEVTGPEREAEEQAAAEDQDVVVEGDLIVEGDVVVTGDAAEEREESGEGFATEPES